MARRLLPVVLLLMSGCGEAPEPVSKAMSEQQKAWYAAEAEVHALWASEQEGDDYAHCMRTADPTGNQWAPGSAKAVCAQLAPQMASLSQIEAKLDSTDGIAALDAEFAALVVAAANDPTKDVTLIRAFSVFDVSARAEDIARRWFAAAPDSKFAIAALALQRARVAVDARGSASAAETTEAQFDRMRSLAEEASPLLAEAMAREPRMTPLCAKSVELFRYGGSEAVARQGYENCQEHGPYSAAFVAQLVQMASPKWGGSFDALAAVSERARVDSVHNPALAQLTTEAESITAGHLRSAMFHGEKVTDEQVAFAKEAAARAPNATLLAMAGNIIASSRGGHWDGMRLISQAVRLAPRVAWIRSARLIHYSADEAVFAARDRAVLAELEGPDFDEVMGSRRSAIPGYQWSADDGTTKWVEERDECMESIRMGGEEGLACSLQLTESEPEDPYAWYLRSEALRATDYAAELAALQRFVETATADEPGLPELRARAAKRLAEVGHGD